MQILDENNFKDWKKNCGYKVTQNNCNASRFIGENSFTRIFMYLTFIAYYKMKMYFWHGQHVNYKIWYE